MNQEYAYIGKDIPMDHALAKAMGEVRYAGDIQLPHMLQAKLLTSPVAHGIVKKIDADEALALPGVRAFLHYGNTPGIHYDQGRVRANEGATDQQTLFTDHVRYVGDWIGVVVAETQELAEQAVSLIKLEIEPLPAYITVDAALQAHEISAVAELPEEAAVPKSLGIHETGECIGADMEYGSVLEEGGDELVKTELFTTSTQRVTHMAMETHAAVADYHPGDRSMTVWSPCQSVFGVRSLIHTLFGLPMSRIRAIKTPMGGSFGGKQEMILEPVAAAASIVTGCPVKIQFTRKEEMISAVLRHPIRSSMKLQFDDKYKIRDLDLTCTLDAGGYQTVTPDYAGSLHAKLSWTYAIPHIHYHSRAVVTNTPITGGYRGWGGPEECLIMETALNEAAGRFGIDPIELRLRNLLPDDAYSMIGNFYIGSSKREECLVRGKERFCWEKRRKKAEATRGSRFIRGVGMAMGVHTSGQYPRKNDWSTVGVKLEEDGSVTVNCNAHDHGCGATTAFRKIAAETLGIPFESVNVPEADTLYNWIDNGCYSSRSIYVTGRSIQQACEELLERIREQEQQMEQQIESAGAISSETEEETMEQRQKRFSGIAYYAADHGCGDISVQHTHKSQNNPGPAAADFAEVEIDTETGKCRVVDFLAVHDIGKVINPVSCRSQVGSAIQQSIGFVFSEEIRIDPETGVVLNPGLKSYHPARSTDMPHMEVLFVEEPDAHGPFGAKSIGEAALVPVAPAILAAVNHALGGTELHDLPIKKETILRALLKGGTPCV